MKQFQLILVLFAVLNLSASLCAHAEGNAASEAAAPVAAKKDEKSCTHCDSEKTHKNHKKHKHDQHPHDSHEDSAKQ